jgi:hypothetical protein
MARMRLALQSIRAVLLGLIVAALIIAAVEGVGHHLYPLPAGLDVNNAEALAAAIAQLPVGALMTVLIGWALGAFAGGWLAARIAPVAPLRHAIVLAVLLLAAGVADMMTIPHPIWFVAAAVLIFPLFAFLGARLTRPR